MRINAAQPAAAKSNAKCRGGADAIAGQQPRADRDVGHRLIGEAQDDVVGRTPPRCRAVRLHRGHQHTRGTGQSVINASRAAPRVCPVTPMKLRRIRRRESARTRPPRRVAGNRKGQPVRGHDHPVLIPMTSPRVRDQRVRPSCRIQRRVGLITSSIVRPDRAWSDRPSRWTTPAVTVCWKPNGLPMADGT